MNVHDALRGLLAYGTAGFFGVAAARLIVWLMSRNQRRKSGASRTNH